MTKTKPTILILFFFVFGNLLAQVEENGIDKETSDSLSPLIISPMPQESEEVDSLSQTEIVTDSLRIVQGDSMPHLPKNNWHLYLSERYINLNFDEKNVYASREKNFSFSAGFLYTTNEHSRSLPTEDDWLNSEYYASPYESGKMGLTYGFSLQLDLKTPLDFINKNISEKIQFSLLPAFSYSQIQFNWQNMVTSPTSEEFGRYFDTKESYKRFHSVGLGLGFMFTYFPETKPNRSEVSWDIYASFIGNYFWKGEFEYKDRMRVYSNATPILLHPSFGTRVKFMKNFYLMAEYNLGVKFQNKNQSNNYIERVYDNNTFVSKNIQTSDKLRLDNLVVGIGFYF